MVRRRTANLLIVFVLVLATASGMVASAPSRAERSARSQAATPQANPVSSDTFLYKAVSPDYRSEVMTATSGRLSRYTITATFHPPGTASIDMIQATPWASPVATPEASPVTGPASVVDTTPIAPVDQATITGIQKLRFVNDTGDPLTDLHFRLYSNLRQYDEGRMEIHNLTVDGQEVQPESPPLYSVPPSTPVATPSPDQADLILLRIPLSDPLAPGATTTVEMEFTTTVPVDPPDGTGLFRFAPDTGSWTLAHWFPILAGYDPASGWETDPPAAWSDLTFSNTALFDVTLTAPGDLVLVTTGVEVEHERQGERQVRRFVSGPVRDFPIVADPNLVSSSTEVNGTTVTSYYTPQNAAGGEQILEWAAQALAVFTELFGPYPYTTLDVVAVPAMIGYEFPQLIFIGADFYPDPIASGSRPGAIEFLVAHEVAHQWWYGLVGSNPHRHAFLDEGLAEYSAVLYFEQKYGMEAADAQLNNGLVLRYATMLITDEDYVADQPTTEFPDLLTYYTTVYRKAGLGFAALRAEIGDEAFFEGVRQYAETMRFEVATPDDLLIAFEETSGRNLDAFWHLWFETASGRVEIVMEPESATPAPATPVASPVASPVD